jgi:hypothetical protein
MKATPLLSLVFLSFKMVTLQRWSESKKTINPNLNPTSILDDNTGWGRVRYPPHLNPDLNQHPRISILDDNIGCEVGLKLLICAKEMHMSLQGLLIITNAKRQFSNNIKQI